MIKFNEGELADTLPIVFTREPETLALSYALKQAYGALWEKYITVYAWAFVDGAPEYVLDLMAAELRVKYYSTDYAVDVKRKLIKTAMLINSKDGTKYAVDTVVQNLFGRDGQVLEWFDYNGENGHFKITLDAVNSYDVDMLLNSIEGVKRKSQHLDGIELKIQHDQSEMYVGHLLLEMLAEQIPGIIPEEFLPDSETLTDENGDQLTDEDGNF